MTTPEESPGFFNIAFMAMKKNLLRYFSILLILTTGAFTYFLISFEKPPVEEITRARMAISAAESIHAAKYAGIVFRDAKSNYDSAISEWQKENNKIFFIRDFSDVERYALLSMELALTSSEKTRSAVTNIRQLLSDQISRIQDEVDAYDRYYCTIPLEEEQRRKLNDGRLLFKEGTFARERQNYLAALEKLDSAEILVLAVTEYSRQIIKDYFADFHIWKQWSEKLISASKKDHITCIIVDKTGRTCNVYKNGILDASYNVELGPNWMGNKLYQGDMSTPEGFYKVVSKKSGSETHYHKALLLNYPNENDIKRFQSNKRNGVIDGNAFIGGLIEIHGHGGKGSDWTNGCIALNNNDIDSLFSICKNGTDVLIIGSLKPIEEVIK